MFKGSVFWPSIVGGMLIGAGCLANEAAGPLTGPFLFAAGLCCVCALGVPLFTGRVGSYLTGSGRPAELLPMLIGGWIGCALCGYAVPGAIGRFGAEPEALPFLGQAVLCGCLMESGVTCWKAGKPIGTVLCVAAFVAAGMQHTIANAFWLGRAISDGAGGYGPYVFCYMIAAAAGNAIGAVLCRAASVRIVQ